MSQLAEPWRRGWSVNAVEVGGGRIRAWRFLPAESLIRPSSPMSCCAVRGRPHGFPTFFRQVKNREAGRSLGGLWMPGARGISGGAGLKRAREHWRETWRRSARGSSRCFAARWWARTRQPLLSRAAPASRPAGARWVVYEGEVEPRVPPEWHRWLHHTTDEPPTEAPLRAALRSRICPISPAPPRLAGILGRPRPRDRGL